MTELNHAKHGVGQSRYHLVLGTKYHCKVFEHSYPKKVCMDGLRKAAEDHGIEIIEMEVMPDHAHLFVNLPPDMSVSKAFQLFKGVSGRLFFKKCTKWRDFLSKNGERQPHLWSAGKYFGSVGDVTPDVLRNYITNGQKKHGDKDD